MRRSYVVTCSRFIVQDLESYHFAVCLASVIASINSCDTVVGNVKSGIELCLKL